MCCLGESLRLIFLDNIEIENSQRAKISAAVIAAHVALASGAAWTPVPAVDSILITSLQITMILGLFKVWGVAGELQTKNFALVFIKACAPALIGFGVGYGIAQLLKFIPLYGTVAGGALSMTIAALATIVIGVGVVIYLKNRAHVLSQKAGIELEDDVYQFMKENKELLSPSAYFSGKF